MGKKARLAHEAVVISRRCGGSRRHQKQRHQLLMSLFNFLQANHQLPERIKDIETQCIQEYFQMRKSSGDAPGHLHNIASALRVILRSAGRKTDDISNAKLALTARDRTGKREPIGDEELSVRIAKLRCLDEGLFHAARLSRLLGLRTMEALMCTPSLVEWEKALAEGPNALLRVVRGTKNGRPRDVAPIVARFDETRTAVADARRYGSTKGVLIGPRDDLKSSSYKMRRVYRAGDFCGKYTPHTLRYAYACDKALDLLSQGLDKKSVLICLSGYLGHGDSRYRWIKSVYCRSLRDVL